MNCWVPVDGSRFNLRVGPNYARNKRKEPSLQALYEVDTYDVFRSGEKHRHVYSRCTQPSGISQPGVLGIPRRFVVTVMLPDCAAANPLWGHYTGDGATIMFVISGSLRPEYLAALETLEALEVESQRDDLTADEADKIVAARTAARAKLPPSIDLLRRFVDESRTDKSIGNRFKLMVNVLNLSESGLDSWSQSVLRRYNAKPCLTRPQHEFFVGPRLAYFEAWVDVHQFAYFARRVFDGIRHLLDGVNLNVGFCIEAQPDEEQPEQMLMCFGARKIARDCEDMLDWPFGKKHPDYVPPPKVDRSENSLHRSLPFSDAEEKTIF